MRAVGVLRAIEVIDVDTERVIDSQPYYVVEHYMSGDGPRVRISGQCPDRDTAFLRARELIANLQKDKRHA